MTTHRAAAARRVTDQLETLWDYDYVPTHEALVGEYLEDFTFEACDHMYARDERTGFQSVKNVWNEMGRDGEGFWRDSAALPGDRPADLISP